MLLCVTKREDHDGSVTKANGLEPYRYLRYLFTKIPLARTEHDYATLLPPNLTPEQIRLLA